MFEKKTHAIIVNKIILFILDHIPKAAQTKKKYAPKRAIRVHKNHTP